MRPITLVLLGAKFELGQLVATQGALAKIAQAEIITAVQRHQGGDWGDVTKGDGKLNDEALVDGSRILSVYHDTKGTKFYVITEAKGDDEKRSVTTVLLPSEY